MQHRNRSGGLDDGREYRSHRMVSQNGWEQRYGDGRGLVSGAGDEGARKQSARRDVSWQALIVGVVSVLVVLGSSEDCKVR